MKLTKDDREALEKQMHEWMVEQGVGHKSVKLAAKQRKWRELVNARLNHNKQAVNAATKAKETRPPCERIGRTLQSIQANLTP